MLSSIPTRHMLRMCTRCSLLMFDCTGSRIVHKPPATESKHETVSYIDARP